MRCASCAHPLEGRYVHAGGSAFHLECFTCAQCGSRLSRFLVHGGRFFCERCHAERFAPRCGVCQRPIAGKFFKHEGQTIHEACYLKHVAEKCAICDGGLSGRIMLDAWGHKFHESHLRQFPPCDSCGRCTAPEIGGGGAHLGDGRISCTGCLATAVRRESDAKTRYDAIRRQMATWGIVVAEQIPLKLVGRKELAARLSKVGHPMRKGTYGFTHMETHYEVDGSRLLPRHEITDQNACIFILHSLPAELFDGAVAHEIGHAWAFLSGCPRHQPQLAEGSCNYFRWRLHEERGTPEALAHMKTMLEDRDPAYGQGFRRVKKYVERNGFAALLELLRRSSDFPLFSFI